MIIHISDRQTIVIGAVHIVERQNIVTAVHRVYRIKNAYDVALATGHQYGDTGNDQPTTIRNENTPRNVTHRPLLNLHTAKFKGYHDPFPLLFFTSSFEGMVETDGQA